MRYSKEYKIECIKKYKNGEYIQDPGGCTQTFLLFKKSYVAGDKGYKKYYKMYQSVQK